MVAGRFITGRFITGRFNTVGSSHGRFITRSIQHRSIHHKNCYIQLYSSSIYRSVKLTHVDYYQENVYVIVIKKMSKLKFIIKIILLK